MGALFTWWLFQAFCLKILVNHAVQARPSGKDLPKKCSPRLNVENVERHGKCRGVGCIYETRSSRVNSRRRSNERRFLWFAEKLAEKHGLERNRKELIFRLYIWKYGWAQSAKRFPLRCVRFPEKLHYVGACRTFKLSLFVEKKAVFLGLESVGWYTETTRLMRINADLIGSSESWQTKTVTWSSAAELEQCHLGQISAQLPLAKQDSQLSGDPSSLPQYPFFRKLLFCWRIGMLKRKEIKFLSRFIWEVCEYSSSFNVSKWNAKCVLPVGIKRHFWKVGFCNACVKYYIYVR